MIDLTAPANMSPCGTWRLSLCRRLTSNLFKPPRPLVLCGYNPSTADHFINDPTIVREMDFGLSFGCDWLIKVNIFAGRATDPNDLATMDDPVGPENDDYIRAAIQFAAEHNGRLGAVWGVPKGRATTRRLAVQRMAEVKGWAPWEAFVITKEGHPKHPLYLPKKAQLQPWARGPQPAQEG